MTTTELIKSCLKGHPEAEKQLFFRFGGKVMTICKRYAAQQAEAKDLLQECFIVVFEKLGKYDASKGDFEGWLYKVCTNVILQHLRKEKRGIDTIYPSVLPDQQEEIIEQHFDQLMDEELLQAIQELPEGYRQILNLYIFDGLRHQDIALRLNISPGTSRSQYARAKKLLKVILQKKFSKNKSYHEKRLA